MKAICAAPLGVALVLFAIPQVSAEGRCKMAWETPAADSKYTQQYTMDVGDIPGHQIRIVELHRVYPNDKPNCEGLKRVETWNHGFSDYVDRNGRVWDTKPQRSKMATRSSVNGPGRARPSSLKTARRRAPSSAQRHGPAAPASIRASGASSGTMAPSTWTRA
jgi:hypothetical protein